MAQLPADIRTTLERVAIEAAAQQRARGPAEDAAALEALRKNGMTIRDVDGQPLIPVAERLWDREARALDITSWLEAIRA
jgi:TRAP-type C4-dicarboxylate transport system substrate-binding protein